MLRSQSPPFPVPVATVSVAEDWRLIQQCVQGVALGIVEQGDCILRVLFLLKRGQLLNEPRMDSQLSYRHSLFLGIGTVPPASYHPAYIERK